MASITLKRKVLKNRHKAKNKNIFIKRLNAKPVLKNIDVQEVKASFKNNAPAKAEKEAPKKEAVEAKVEETPVVEETPKVEEAPKAEAETEEAPEAKEEDKKEEE